MTIAAPKALRSRENKVKFDHGLDLYIKWGMVLACGMRMIGVCRLKGGGQAVLCSNPDFFMFRAEFRKSASC